MRLLSVRLIISLIVGITVVSLAFSYYQVIAEKRALRSELERRAELLGESLAGNVERSWEVGSDKELQKIVQRFGKREYMLGVAIYDPQGKLVAVTPELTQMMTATPSSLIEALAEDQNKGAFVRLGNQPVHILAVPLHRKDKLVGGLAIVHQVSYIRAQVLQVWRDTFLRVLAQVFLIVFITLLIVRWSIAGPIARAAQWKLAYAKRVNRSGQPIACPFRFKAALTALACLSCPTGSPTFTRGTGSQLTSACHRAAW